MRKENDRYCESPGGQVSFELPVQPRHLLQPITSDPLEQAHKDGRGEERGQNVTSRFRQFLLHDLSIRSERGRCREQYEAEICSANRHGQKLRRQPTGSAKCTFADRLFCNGGECSSQNRNLERGLVIGDPRFEWAFMQRRRHVPAAPRACNGWQ
jgi:hypothetical protein